MDAYRIAKKLWKMALVASSTAVILSSSCALDDVRTIAAGVENVSRELSNNGSDDDISFAEWLLDELD